MTSESEHNLMSEEEIARAKGEDYTPPEEPEEGNTQPQPSAEDVQQAQMSGMFQNFGEVLQRNNEQLIQGITGALQSHLQQPYQQPPDHDYEEPEVPDDAIIDIDDYDDDDPTHKLVKGMAGQFGNFSKSMIKRMEAMEQRQYMRDQQDQQERAKAYRDSFKSHCEKRMSEMPEFEALPSPVSWYVSEVAARVQTHPMAQSPNANLFDLAEDVMKQMASEINEKQSTTKAKTAARHVARAPGKQAPPPPPPSKGGGSQPPAGPPPQSGKRKFNFADTAQRRRYNREVMDTLHPEQ